MLTVIYVLAFWLGYVCMNKYFRWRNESEYYREQIINNLNTIINILIKIEREKE